MWVHVPCLLEGSRPEHEMVNNFFVTLTPASVIAAMDAQKKVASNWRTGPLSAPTAARKRVRNFKTAARAANRAKKVGVKKTAMKPKSSAPKPVAPVQKAKEAIEGVPSNYSRSAKGFLLIKQQMESLHQLDKVQFPKNPLFAAGDEGECRLRLLGFASFIP